jgi:large subunit ribosomal protein L18
MKSGKNTLKFRRKREGKTDYRLRRQLLTSKIPRLVVRKSLNNISGQIIVFDPVGDKVIAKANSTELVELGWKFNKSNLPAAYLTGLLLGTRFQKKCVLDIGLYVSSKGSKLYSFAKGATEAGLELNCSEEILPSEERTTGKHISILEEEKGRFSKYKKEGKDWKNLPSDVETIKNKILNGGKK